MRGVGWATGAVTVVNALFTGVGAAAAIDLPVRAEVRIELGTSTGAATEIEPDSDSPLVRAVLADALRRYRAPSGASVRLAIESSVPRGVGLKSSSAVSVAVGRAVADALSRSSTPEDEARAAARVACRIGQSATGAFDDALAAATGGIVVTDNSRTELLARWEPGDGRSALLWMSGEEHPPSPLWAERFRALAASAADLADSARSGDWSRAMLGNGELVERALGQDRRGLRERLLASGATATSISGLGPTLAVIAPPARIESLRELLPPGEGTVRIARLLPSTPAWETAR